MIKDVRIIKQTNNLKMKGQEGNKMENIKNTVNETNLANVTNTGNITYTGNATNISNANNIANAKNTKNTKNTKVLFSDNETKHKYLLDEAAKHLKPEDYNIAKQLTNNNILEAFINSKVNKSVIQMPLDIQVCFESKDEFCFCCVDQEGVTSYQRIEKLTQDESLISAASRLRQIIGNYSIYYAGERLNEKISEYTRKQIQK